MLHKAILLIFVLGWGGDVVANDSFPSRCGIEWSKPVSESYPASLKGMDMYYCAMVELLNSRMVGQLVHPDFVIHYINTSPTYKNDRKLIDCVPTIKHTADGVVCPIHINDYKHGTTHLIDRYGGASIDNDWLVKNEDIDEKNEIYKSSVYHKIINSNFVRSLKSERRSFLIESSTNFTVVSSTKVNALVPAYKETGMMYPNRTPQLFTLEHSPENNKDFTLIKNCSLNANLCNSIFELITRNDPFFMAQLAKQVIPRTVSQRDQRASFCAMSVPGIMVEGSLPLKCTAKRRGLFLDLIYPWVANEVIPDPKISNLTVINNNALANGTDTNRVKVLVTDSNNKDNPLAGETVKFTASNGATITATATTDTEGIAIATLTNTRAGISRVTAELHNKTIANIDTGFSNISIGNIQVVTWNSNCTGTYQEINSNQQTIDILLNSKNLGHNCSRRPKQELYWSLKPDTTIINVAGPLYTSDNLLYCNIDVHGIGKIIFNTKGVITTINVQCLPQ